MTVEYKNWSPQGHRHLTRWQIHADNLQFQGHLDLTYQETEALLKWTANYTYHSS